MSHGPYGGETLNSLFLFASPCLNFKLCYLIILILGHVSFRSLIRCYQPEIKKKLLKQSFYGIKCLGGFNTLLPECLCLYWGHYLTLLSGQGQLQVLLLEGAACSLSKYRHLIIFHPRRGRWKRNCVHKAIMKAGNCTAECKCRRIKLRSRSYWKFGFLVVFNSRLLLCSALQTKLCCGECNYVIKAFTLVHLDQTMKGTNWIFVWMLNSAGEVSLQVFHAFMCLCCSWVICFYNPKSFQVVSELACPIPLLPCFPLWGFGLGGGVDNHSFSPFPWCILKESSFICQLFVVG